MTIITRTQQLTHIYRAYYNEGPEEIISRSHLCWKQNLYHDQWYQKRNQSTELHKLSELIYEPNFIFVR